MVYCETKLLQSSVFHSVSCDSNITSTDTHQLFNPTYAACVPIAIKSNSGLWKQIGVNQTNCMLIDRKKV